MIPKSAVRLPHRDHLVAVQNYVAMIFMDDNTFFTLPVLLRKRIDQAFYSVAQGVSETSWKSRDTGNDLSGGFVFDDLEPGGFLVEESHPVSQKDSLLSRDENQGNVDTDASATIPLASVPTALQLLDIQPDDPEILNVFRNASSGWNGIQEEGEAAVSKDDWRAVCAVLLEGSANGDERTDGESEGIADYVTDEYEEEASADDGDEDDEYVDKPESKSTPTRKTRRVASSPILSPHDDPLRPLTARQKHECRKAYGLFFPDVLDAELDGKKIMIKDITRVAKELKEKLKAEEILEMLDMFSTEKDKSMSLKDFERMMVTAKMV